MKMKSNRVKTESLPDESRRIPDEIQKFTRNKKLLKRTGRISVPLLSISEIFACQKPARMVSAEPPAIDSESGKFDSDFNGHKSARRRFLLVLG